jgi:hypothetical protein
MLCVRVEPDKAPRSIRRCIVTHLLVSDQEAGRLSQLLSLRRCLTFTQDAESFRDCLGDAARRR